MITCMRCNGAGRDMRAPIGSDPHAFRSCAECKGRGEVTCGLAGRIVHLGEFGDMIGTNIITQEDLALATSPVSDRCSKGLSLIRERLAFAHDCHDEAVCVRALAFDGYGNCVALGALDTKAFALFASFVRLMEDWYYEDLDAALSA